MRIKITHMSSRRLRQSRWCKALMANYVLSSAHACFMGSCQAWLQIDLRNTARDKCAFGIPHRWQKMSQPHNSNWGHTSWTLFEQPACMRPDDNRSQFLTDEEADLLKSEGIVDAINVRMHLVVVTLWTKTHWIMFKNVCILHRIDDLAQQPALSCSTFPLPRWWHRVPQVSSLPAYQNAAGKVWTVTERNLYKNHHLD